MRITHVKSFANEKVVKNVFTQRLLKIFEKDKILAETNRNNKNSVPG